MTTTTTGTSAPSATGATSASSAIRAPGAPSAAYGTCAPAADWFHVADLGDGITLISEPGHVNCFLVQGTERALLFDTGTGLAPVSEVVRHLTDLPLLVVVSHDHLDHRGGNADVVAHADELALVGIAAHPSTLEPGSTLHGAVDRTFLDAYAEAMRTVVDQYETFAALDAQSFYVLPTLDAGDSPLRPVPDTTSWAVPAVRPDVALADGDVLDLGGRSLRVVHTPGHSPDSLCLVDDAHGVLLAGDTVVAAASWLHGAGADLDAFARSTAALAGLPLRRVLTAHNLCAERPPSYVRSVAQTAERVRAGQSTPRPGTDLLGNPVDRHTHDGVTLLLPPSPTSPTAPSSTDPQPEEIA